MPQEIERKFLVIADSWRSHAIGKPYRQGYIPTAEPGKTVRVRIAGDQGYLTIKGPTQSLSRAEFEYAIPLSDAQEMLETLCNRPFIEKIRYRLPIDDVVWEIDEFQGENAGLVIAEVELSHENQSIEHPDWLGQDVSGDMRYQNSNLVKRPYSTW